MASGIRTFDSPHFCRTVVCVTDDAALAAMVCSAIGTDGEYVAIVRRPRDWHPMVRRRELAQFANTIHKIQPEIVLLLSLDKQTADEFVSKFGSTRVRNADTHAEAMRLVARFQRPNVVGEFPCRPEDVGMGLLLAKRANKLLVIDGAASPISSRPASEHARHVVAIDDDDRMTHVVAANYAFSIGADLFILPPREDDLKDVVYAAIDARHAHRGSKRATRASGELQKLERELRPALEFGPCHFVTFITEGFPYGYFYQSAPSTHIFSSTIFNSIVASIYWTRYWPATVSALLIDPGDFENSETDDVARLFREQGSVVVELRNERASVHDSRLSISGLPFDFLFICSHCGEVGGYRIAVPMQDTEGKSRIVEFDTVMTVVSKPREKDGEPAVLVNDLYVPVAVDGVDWFSLPGGLRTHFWELHMKQRNPKHRDQTLRRIAVKRVPHSTAIQLFDGVLILNMLQVLDVSVSPVIFNNSCVSFFDAASSLIHGGARSYIGTLAPVDDRYAREFAITVLSSAESKHSLALALHRAHSIVRSPMCASGVTSTAFRGQPTKPSTCTLNAFAWRSTVGKPMPKRLRATVGKRRPNCSSS